MLTYIGKQRALSLDIWISPNLCLILGERQCVSLLRSAWEKYKRLGKLASVRSVMVRYTEPETHCCGFESD